jgi:hypothetical protein
MPNYSGVWTLSQQFQGRGQGLWPTLPSAPTIGSATAGDFLCASVTFSPPATSVPPPTSYTATSTPGGFTATGATSPLTVTGLTFGTAYTFRVKATNADGTGPCSAASNSITGFKRTCATFTSGGTYTWVVPTGVTSISAVVVGGGGGGRGGYTCGGGGGGGLAYRNTYSVTPGQSLTVTVGNGGNSNCGSAINATAGGLSQLAIGCTTIARAMGGGGGNSSNGGGGFAVGTGGAGGGTGVRGGGGAGGYSGTGGTGGGNYSTGNAGSGGAGGGGGGNANAFFYNAACNSFCYASGSGGGGGVGLYGSGTSGAGGSAGSTCGQYANGGGGGGGGSPSTGTGTAGGGGGFVGPGLDYNGTGGSGGARGGGGGTGGRSVQCGSLVISYTNGGGGGTGAVRIVWQGCGRGAPSFPSTNVGP